MILALEDEHKEHLAFLNTVPVDVVKEFCRISVEFIRKGPNPKVYQSASQKLGVASSTVQHGVEGLMYLFTESAKLMLNEADLQGSLVTLGFPDELVQEIQSQCISQQAEIRGILSQMTLDLPHYHNLHWRLDVKLASRALRQQTDPVITMKLYTKTSDGTKAQELQTDPVNLLHLTQTLEAALQELKSPHCRRILRNI